MALPPINLFEVVDKYGVRVRLSTRRWELHILERRPELTERIEEIKEVIQRPQIVTLNKGGSHHFSCLGIVTKRKWRRLYLEVVFKYRGLSGSQRGEVLTVHFNGMPPKGEMKWLTLQK